MKKICITALLLGASFSLFAQTMSPTNPIKYSMPNTYLEKPYTYSPQKMNNTLSSTSRWYNYYDALLQQGLQPNLYPGVLFPDTSILVQYVDNNNKVFFRTPWVHAIADVLDVKSNKFNDVGVFGGELALNKTSSYKLDSINFNFLYRRKLNTVVDTLQFDVAVNNVESQQFFSNYIKGATVKADYGIDTVFFKNIAAYDATTNSLTLPNRVSFKIPLNDSIYKDSTSNGLHRVLFPTTGVPTVTAGKYVVTSIKFIPGYTWAANTDTLNTKNTVYFLSGKEVDNQYSKSYDQRDYNVSYVANNQSKYDTAAQSWKGQYLPYFAFVKEYVYEHHDIWYKISCGAKCDVVSTNDLVSSKNAVILDDAYPNPFNKSTVVSYELPKQARVSLEIYDITGRKLMTYNEGSQSSGKHSISVDASKLAKGIYFYTLRADEVSITKRMVIAE